MAAFAFGPPGPVRRAVYEYTKSPFIFGAIKSFFFFWSSTKKNANLQLLPFTQAGVTGASGQALAQGAAKIYAVYAAPGPDNDEASYLVLLDDATDDSGGATDARYSVKVDNTTGEHFAVFPNGIPVAAGVVAKGYTDYDGTTDPTAAADAPYGWVIVGV